MIINFGSYSGMDTGELSSDNLIEIINACLFEDAINPFYDIYVYGDIAIASNKELDRRKVRLRYSERDIVYSMRRAYNGRGNMGHLEQAMQKPGELKWYRSRLK